MFSILFRKYPIFRTAIYAVLVLLFIGAISFFTKQNKKEPLVERIDPPVGKSGETVSIFGSNFGNERGKSFVEIGGNRITSSSYISWTNSEIKIVLPQSFRDGFLSVCTANGKSRQHFFANSQTIPIIVSSAANTIRPSLSSASPSTGGIGSLITLTGANFGNVRGSSSVVFRSDDGSEICADEHNFDYESWSDSEIRVRIPDGAKSGNVLVKTERGESGTKSVVVNSPGKKTFLQEKVFSIRLEEDIDEVSVSSNSILTLRVPRPIVYSLQPSVVMNECEPPPIIADFQNSVIHQIELKKLNAEKVHFTQDFVVTTRAVRTKIDSRSVKNSNLKEKNSALYDFATSADSLIPADNGKIEALASEIAKKEKNPFLIAKAVYSYFVENFSLLPSVRSASADSLLLLSRKSGDAFDFAVIYAAVLRSLKIPAIAVSGILVNSDRSAKAHWWNEFYIDGFGWIPVDLALGAGLEFEPFLDSIPEEMSARDFYFGNLDAQHIAFSRGWNEIRPSLANGKIVQRPRSFALQSIWEESSGKNVNYSSLWNDPIVLGVY